jgi:DNA helicase II / ATP-dependent DNA helicase PcrA
MQVLSVQRSEIDVAELLLFNRVGVLNAEQVSFIQNFQRIDVLAVPGSGKTTALIAKIIILLNRQKAFLGAPSILVLTHSNASANSILERLGEFSSRLQNYPNFIGTIQSFIDRYLAIPYFQQQFGRKPIRIDAIDYSEAIERRRTINLGITRPDMSLLQAYLSAQDVRNLATSYRLGLSTDSSRIVLNELNGASLVPKRVRGGDYSSSEKIKILDLMIMLKVAVWSRDFVMHYDDAYFFASEWLLKNPRLASIIRDRFKFVFIDEMQDLESHQVGLLEAIFFDATNSSQTYQRIGDPNQAIYNRSVHIESNWNVRAEKLTIFSSSRLSARNAHVARAFGLSDHELISANGVSTSLEIPPKIYLFDHESVSLVLPAFVSDVLMASEKAGVQEIGKEKVKAICWIKHEVEVDKYSLENYLSHFGVQQPMQLEGNMENWLAGSIVNRLNKVNVSQISEFLTAVWKACGIRIGNEDVSLQEVSYFLKSDNHEIKSTLLSLTKSFMIKDIGQFKAKILTLTNFIPDLHKTSVEKLNSFIQSQELLPKSAFKKVDFASSIKDRGVNIDFATVHKVKGESHFATLYLESAYQSDRTRNEDKRYESQRLRNQLKGIPAFSDQSLKSRGKQSARIAYVAMTRPTHLLGFAAQKTHFIDPLSHYLDNGWEILDLTKGSDQKLEVDEFFDW